MRIKVSFLIKFAYNLLELSTGLRNILLVCNHPNFMSTHNVSMSISLVSYKILNFESASIRKKALVQGFSGHCDNSRSPVDSSTIYANI